MKWRAQHKNGSSKVVPRLPAGAVLVFDAGDVKVYEAADVKHTATQAFQLSLEGVVQNLIVYRTVFFPDHCELSVPPDVDVMRKVVGHVVRGEYQTHGRPRGRRGRRARSNGSGSEPATPTAGESEDVEEELGSSDAGKASDDGSTDKEDDDEMDDDSSSFPGDEDSEVDEDVQDEDEELFDEDNFDENDSGGDEGGDNFGSGQEDL